MPPSTSVTRASLGILDLVPLSEGNSPSATIQALKRSVQRAEASGYSKYLFAEHHFSSGILGTSPAIFTSLAAAATSRIVLGSAAVQLGANSIEQLVAEDFALLAAAFPGRVELGLGRSALSVQPPQTSAPQTSASAAPGEADAPGEFGTDDGLLIPAPFNFGTVLAGPRVKEVVRVLSGGAVTAPRTFAEQVEEVLRLLEPARERERDDIRVRLAFDTDLAADLISDTTPALQVRLYGSNTYSAELAGRLGLPFAANYHSAPSGVLRASQAYLRAFRPSEHLAEPHLAVSADVVVASTEDEAQRRASGYPAWVLAIRQARGAIPYPKPDSPVISSLSDDDHQLVSDRVRTQFVGNPESVAARLEVLQQATGANELILTSIAHDVDARDEGLELIAREWFRR